LSLDIPEQCIVWRILIHYRRLFSASNRVRKICQCFLYQHYLVISLRPCF